MAGRAFRGLRTITERGNSATVTLPKPEIERELDVEIEQLIGEDIPCRVEGNSVIYELEQFLD